MPSMGHVGMCQSGVWGKALKNVVLVNFGDSKSRLFTVGLNQCPTSLKGFTYGPGFVTTCIGNHNHIYKTKE